MVEVETFRALARSSPWLWSSVRLTRTMVGQENDERVCAWIRRPGLMRVEPDGGEPYTVDETRNVGRGAVLYSTAPSRRRSLFARLFGRPARPGLYTGLGDGLGGDGLSTAALGSAALRSAELSDDTGSVRAPSVEPEFRTPQDPLAPQPERRDDGLVTKRPNDFSVGYDDPMHVNYLWVAMLDPVELADGLEPDAGGPDDAGDTDRTGAGAQLPGVEVLELTESLRHGRPTLDALVRPTGHYNPRCTCCALLFSEVTAELLREEGAPLPEPWPVFAEAHRVVLDRGTGICVSLRDIGGDRDGVGFDVEIEEVDVEYPEEMFR
jgi:hypothetical protein